MPDIVNEAGMRHARSLIADDKIDRESRWEMTADDENEILGPNLDDWAEYEKWFIAIDTDANEETKARFKYPFGKNGQVYRSGVIAAKSRAAQQGETDISDAADRLLQLIDADQERSAIQWSEKRIRSFPVKTRGPQSINHSERSVVIDISTEQPVPMYDFETNQFIPEVLLASGVVLPETRKIPLVDSHDTTSVRNILGSIRNVQPEGIVVSGKAYVSEAEPDIWTKVVEEHIDSASAGYQISEQHTIRLADGDEQQIGERSFIGPLLVRTQWRLAEGSLVAIGADSNAKIRSEERAKERDNIKNKPQKEQTMTENKELKTTDSTEQRSDESAVQARDDTDNQVVEPEIDIEKERAEAAKKAAECERKRIAEITAACRKCHLKGDFAETLIRDEVDIPTAMKMIHDEWSKRYVAEEQADGHVAFIANTSLISDERDRFREAVFQGLSMRTGKKIDKPVPGANDLRHFSMIEIVKESLRMAGESVKGNPMEVVKRAMATSDFPNILANVGQQKLYEGFSSEPLTWNLWCQTDNLANFQTTDLPYLGSSATLPENPEGVDFQDMYLSDSKETVKLAKFAGIWRYTFEMIVNDNLGAFNQARIIGSSAARTVERLVYTTLIANANMGDGNPLFDAAHGNLAAGGNVGPVGIATMNAAILAMGTQTDPSGNDPLNIAPEYYIAPKSVQGQSTIFFTSEDYVDEQAIGTVDEAVAGRRKNPYAQGYKLIFSPYLDTDSTTAWYLAAGRNTMVVYFWNGQEEPMVMDQRSTNSMDFEFKVMYPVVAKPIDWRGLYKNPGV
jgi:hypothetical protein